MDEMFVGIMVDFFDRYDSDEKYAKRAKVAIDLVKKYNPKAKNVLEIACGTGNFTKQLVSAGYTVNATDISEDEIELAKSKNINAQFSVADMSKLDIENKYDIIGCFWESFRYLPSYEVCQDTLHRIHAALKSKGIFIVDFACFPPTTKPVTLPAKTIDVGKGILVTQQVTLQTKGNFDVRSDIISYKQNGKDITGTEISWRGKKIILKNTGNRSPQIRISKEKMNEMLQIAGLKLLEVQGGFNGYPESTLFVSQKK